MMGGMTALAWFWAILVAGVLAVAFAGLVWPVRTRPRLADLPTSAGAAGAELNLLCAGGAFAGEADLRRRTDLGTARS
jgi:hypothetical protein